MLQRIVKGLNSFRINGRILGVVGFFALVPISLFAQKYTFTQPKMGSPFHIIVYTQDSLRAAQAAQVAFVAVDSLNQIFSDYLPDSELSAINRTAGTNKWVQVSPALADIVRQSLKASKLSRGAFDIAIGALVKQWRQVRKTKNMIPDSVRTNLVKAIGYQNIVLKNNAIKLLSPQVQLDLGGIAKGYAAQVVVLLMTQAGFPSVIADAGGDLAIGKRFAATKPFQIALNLPESENLMNKYLSLENQAVATSGAMYQFVEIQGKRYSHIVNPHTGFGLTHQRNVTVVAPTGAMADWLATACSVLDPQSARRLINKIPQTAMFIAEWQGDSLKTWQSSRWTKLTVK